MIAMEQVRGVLATVLQLGERAARMDRDTELLGGIPEFDSMAVVSILGALEDEFGIEVDDDISAETFATLGTLTDFVNARVAA